MLFIKFWGAPDLEKVNNIRKSLQSKDSSKITAALFTSQGSLQQHLQDSPEKAIEIVQNEILGFGPTYSSKLLRFACPEEFGAIDTTVARAFGPTGRNWISEIEISRSR